MGGRAGHGGFDGGGDCKCMSRGKVGGRFSAVDGLRGVFPCNVLYT